MVEAGQNISESTVVVECLQTGKRVIRKVGAEILGFSYKNCSPILIY